jgi:hypothetical protein
MQNDFNLGVRGNKDTENFLQKIGQQPKLLMVGFIIFKFSLEVLRQQGLNNLNKDTYACFESSVQVHPTALSYRGI